MGGTVRVGTMRAQPEGQNRIGRVVDLQGGVRDAVVVEQLLQVGPHRVAVLAGGDEHVCGRGWHPRRDLPDVQVMDLGHVRPGGHGRADVRRGDADRRRLEEDAAGIPDQAGPRRQHEGHDDQRGDGVGPREAGQHDDDAGHGGSGEGVDVGENVPERALDVQAPARSPAGPADQHGHRHVDRHPGQRDADNHPSGHGGRGDEPAYRLERQPGGQHNQSDPVGLRGENLGALQPVGVAALRRPGGQLHRDQHQADGCRVGQHVRRVRDQRQRVGGQAGHDLGGHERDDQRERGTQPPRVAAGGRPVPVAIPVGLVLVSRRPGRLARRPQFVRDIGRTCRASAAGHGHPPRSGCAAAGAWPMWVRATSTSIRTCASASR